MLALLKQILDASFQDLHLTKSLLTLKTQLLNRVALNFSIF